MISNDKVHFDSDNCKILPPISNIQSLSTSPICISSNILIQVEDFLEKDKNNLLLEKKKKEKRILEEKLEKDPKNKELLSDYGVLKSFFNEKKYHWKIASRHSREGKIPEFMDTSELDNYSKFVHQYFEKKFNGKLYKHQVIALKELRTEKNVCISTPTGSGKSAIFYAYGIQLLSTSVIGRILVMYPTNALAREQYDRWKEVLELSGLPTDNVGIIIGGTPEPERVKILKRAQIVITNPDTLQMWMLNRLCNVSKKNQTIGSEDIKEDIKIFLKNIRLIILDEIHIYKAAFGSNVAYLLRRLNFATALLSSGKIPQYIAASATIGNPEAFLKNLIGYKFEIIGPEIDASKQENLDFLFVNSPYAGPVESIQKILLFFADYNEHADHKDKIRTIAFLDGRQTVEKTILTNIYNTQEESDKNEDIEILDSKDGKNITTSSNEIDQEVDKNISYDPESEYEDNIVFNTTQIKNLMDHSIYPYRAGYNIQEIQDIMLAIREGKLNGIVSTSALELGIDIPFLNVAVLYGVPESSSSLLQRIGRVGRHEPGLVIVINDNKVRSVDIFSKPENFDKLQQEIPYLYLENKSIMFRNAAMFIGEEGEFETLTNRKNVQCKQFFNGKNYLFPEKFIELIKIIVDRQNNQILKEYGSEIDDIGNAHFLGIRNIGQQYRLCRKVFNNDHELGSTIGYDQIFREAYPGAIYLHRGNAYRVLNVSNYDKKVILTTYKGLAFQKTSPIKSAPKVSPEFENYTGILFESEISQHWFIIAGCNIRIENIITGYRSKVGKNHKTISYQNIKANPDDKETNPHSLKYKKPNFNQILYTNGVTIYSSLFQNIDSDSLKKFGEILFGSCLSEIIVDRQDVDYSLVDFKTNFNQLHEIIKSKYGNQPESCKSIVIFDKITYGLGLALQILDTTKFYDIIEKAYFTIRDDFFRKSMEINPTVESLIINLFNLIVTEKAQVIDFTSRYNDEDSDLVFDVIKPGEKAMHCVHGMGIIRDIEIHKKNGKMILKYEFTPFNKEGKVPNNAPVFEIKILERISPIEGISQVGTYSLSQEDFID